jgi:flagellar basal body rod protein FlgC
MRIDAAAVNGMWAHQAMFTSAAGSIANTGSPDVQLAEEIVNTTVAQIGYTANARVLTTHDEVSGTLVDELA